MVDDFEQLPDEPEWYKGFNRTKAGAIRGTVMCSEVNKLDYFYSVT